MIPGIVIIAITLVVGVWLSTVYTALKNITWGTIRKLDPKKDKALIYKAESWLEMRNSYRITLRLLTLMDLACMVSGVYMVVESGLKVQHFDTAIIFAVIATYLFVLITESISAMLTGDNWKVLRLSMPVVYFIHWFARFFIIPAVRVHAHLEHVRYNEDEDEKVTMEDEIEAILDHEAHSKESEQDDDRNGIEESTGRMIRGVLELDETLVKEIMTPRVDVTAVEINTPLRNLRKSIVDSGHSRIPVYKENIDDIVGVVYSKNMLDDENVTESTQIKDIMHQAVYIPETKDVDELLQEFKQKKVHLAIVIDEYGGTSGIVSLEDILEEIVGEIADEFDDADEEEPTLLRAEDGSLEVEGRTDIEDVNEALNLGISEDEDNVTIGGFVTSQLGRIPKAGETVELDGFSAEILEADERKIERMVLRLPENTPNPEN